MNTRWWKCPITGLLLKNGVWKTVNKVQIRSAYLKKEVNRGKIVLRGLEIPEAKPEKAVLTGKLSDTKPLPAVVTVKAKPSFKKTGKKSKKGKK